MPKPSPIVPGAPPPSRKPRKKPKAKSGPEASADIDDVDPPIATAPGLVDTPEAERPSVLASELKHSRVESNLSTTEPNAINRKILYRNQEAYRGLSMTPGGAVIDSDFPQTDETHEVIEKPRDGKSEGVGAVQIEKEEKEEKKEEKKEDRATTASKVGRRLSARVGDFFKARPKYDVSPPAKVDEHPQKIDEPAPLTLLDIPASENAAVHVESKADEAVQPVDVTRTVDLLNVLRFSLMASGRLDTLLTYKSEGSTIYSVADVLLGTDDAKRRAVVEGFLQGSGDFDGLSYTLLVGIAKAGLALPHIPAPPLSEKEEARAEAEQDSHEEEQRQPEEWKRAVGEGEPAAWKSRGVMEQEPSSSGVTVTALVLPRAPAPLSEEEMLKVAAEAERKKRDKERRKREEEEKRRQTQQRVVDRLRRDGVEAIRKKHEQERHKRQEQRERRLEEQRERVDESDELDELVWRLNKWSPGMPMSMRMQDLLRKYIPGVMEIP